MGFGVKLRPWQKFKSGDGDARDVGTHGCHGKRMRRNRAFALSASHLTGISRSRERKSLIDLSRLRSKPSFWEPLIAARIEIGESLNELSLEGMSSAD